MKVKAILFDLDGTIFDIFERDSFARFEALNCLGYNVSLDEVKKHYRYGIGRMGVVEKLGIELTEREKQDYLRLRFASFMDRRNARNHTRTHRGAHGALSTLSRNYKLVLVTSRNKLSYVEEETRWFDLRSFFDLIVTREVAAKYHGLEDIPLLPFEKQRSKLYDCVIGMTNINPEDLVCVGDSVGELAPAKKLKIKTIGVLSGFSSEEDLRKCSDFIVQDISQVGTILARATHIVKGFHIRNRGSPRTKTRRKKSS